ncbi:Membrane-associated protein in eicosanoid and glutathione metabolism [Sulfitobacter noctilucicola]|uniref:Glutathione S-transferase n=1 Tax=Sulfitobacter noctilucicola TaxID=1342301 RepID=A0A7W6Q5K7_9RHOB|nr:MAPEG family protein [Sulfitobacter noctilucicola]KIN64048.1 Membrane-associated protein in eicosanoid and glutathione metabolism [Sulfitobacter noctilucicola]MBB4175404.1 hypothetical protein [Sulfitobacter noctilucicola]
MSVTITPIYAGLAALIYLALTARVITYRRRNLISLGDNDDKALRKRIRAHGNWAEYAPVALFLLLLIELSQAPAIALHLMGLGIVAGRTLHAIGFSSTPQKMILRQLGMVLTLLSIGLGSLGLIGHTLF